MQHIAILFVILIIEAYTYSVYSIVVWNFYREYIINKFHLGVTSPLLVCTDEEDYSRLSIGPENLEDYGNFPIGTWTFGELWYPSCCGLDHFKGP